MSKIILWTQADCPLCERVKALFVSQGYEERAAADLLTGADKDIEAMTQLAMQDMQLPLVMIDGRFVVPQELLGKAA